MSKKSMLFLIAIVLCAAGFYMRLSQGAFKTYAARNSASSGGWTTFQGDLGRSGFNGAETIINPQTAPHIVLKWTNHAVGGISGQPVVVNGLIYWGSWDGLEHATDLTGHDIWTTNIGTTTPPNKQCTPSSAGPAGTATVASLLINGKTTSVVFVSGGNAHFYALDANTGNVLWNTPLGPTTSYMTWAGPAVYNGSVYVGVSSYGDCPLVQGELVQMNASTGAIQHTFKVVANGCKGGGVWDNPTIDVTTNIIYFSTGTIATCSTPETMSLALVALQTSDLSLVGSWQIPASQQIVDSDFGSTPTLFQATINGVLHQMVGLVNKNGIYYAFDRSNISAGPLWQVRLSDVGGGNSFSSSAWDGTTLYVADAATTINGNKCFGSIRALNPADGAFIWQHCLSNRVFSSVFAVPGLLVVGVGGFIIVVDAATGKQLFSFHDTNKGSRFVGSATISDGVLYMGNLDGNLYAFG